MGTGNQNTTLTNELYIFYFDQQSSDTAAAKLELKMPNKVSGR